MRTPQSVFNLLFLLASALLVTGCTSLPGLSSVGPYHRTPSGIWTECEGKACDTPEPLLPEVPGTGGRTGTAIPMNPPGATADLGVGEPLTLNPPSFRLPIRLRDVPLGPCRFPRHGTSPQ